tara:strand:- start:95330 stop:95437 length:108 start_codon:yes stop_codon:yes gene_type:complete
MKLVNSPLWPQQQKINFMLHVQGQREIYIFYQKKN